MGYQRRAVGPFRFQNNNKNRKKESKDIAKQVPVQTIIITRFLYNLSRPYSMYSQFQLLRINHAQCHPAGIQPKTRNIREWNISAS